MLVVTLVDDKGLRHSPATLLKGRARRAVTSVVTALSAMDQGSVEAPYHYAETNTDSGKPDSNWRPQVPQTCKPEYPLDAASCILCLYFYIWIRFPSSTNSRKMLEVAGIARWKCCHICCHGFEY